MADNVVALTEKQALDALRQAGVVEAASITALGKSWGWKRERTGKALSRWKAAGHIEREASADGKIIVRVPAVAHAAAAGDGPAGNPGCPGLDDHIPPDVPAANPGGTASDDVPLSVEEPVGVTGVPENIPAGNSGVPAITAGVKWWILWRPASRPTVAAICRWTFGGMSVVLSFALYFVSTFLNMTFWANLNPDVTAKEILAAGGLVIELTNYVVPSAISFVPSAQRVLRLFVWAVVAVTMIATSVAGASVVRNSLGTSEVSRDQIIRERTRLQAIVASSITEVSDGAVVDARQRVDTTKAVARADCAPAQEGRRGGPGRTQRIAGRLSRSGRRLGWCCRHRARGAGRMGHQGCGCIMGFVVQPGSLHIAAFGAGGLGAGAPRDSLMMVRRALGQARGG